ncbi:hypothetical protein ACFLTH_13075 [Bacteroidota bacterium]
MNSKKIKLVISLVLVVIYIFSALLIETHADPVGASATNTSTSSSVPSSDNRSDEGGSITTLQVSVTQQNFAWKAYVGNMTGSLTLDDANGRTIYDWTISQSSLAGQMFASRISSISWANLACANVTNIQAEETVLTMGATDGDNINHTFSYTEHPTYVIAGQTIYNSTCRSLFTYVNSTAQQDNETSVFSEIVLQNTNGQLIFVTDLESDEFGYSANGAINRTFDFQLIVPDNDEANNQTTYFFYAEIDA